jgi:hypothetical protein
MKIIHDALRTSSDFKKYIPTVEEKGATAYSCNVLNSFSNGGLSLALVDLEDTKLKIADERKQKDVQRRSGFSKVSAVFGGNEMAVELRKLVTRN